MKTKVVIVIEVVVDCAIWVFLASIMYFMGLKEEKLVYIYGGWFFMGVAAFSVIFGYRWKLTTQKLLEEMQKNLTAEEEKTLELKIIEISGIMNSYGFETTDCDSDNGMIQFYKKLPEGTHWYVQFELLVDEVIHSIIDLSEYTPEERARYCEAYDWNHELIPEQLIAEAIFETDIFEFDSDLAYSSGFWKTIFNPKSNV